MAARRFRGVVEFEFEATSTTIQAVGSSLSLE